MNPRIQELYDHVRQWPYLGTVQNVYSDLQTMNIPIPDPVIRVYNQSMENPNDRVKEAKVVATFKTLLRQLGAREPRGASRRRIIKRRKTFKKRTARRT
jgi:hypothetical protein